MCPAPALSSPAHERGEPLAVNPAAFEQRQPSLVLDLAAPTSISTPTSVNSTARKRGPNGGGEERAAAEPLSLTTVIETLSTLGKAELPARLARWLDALDETGRWALIKLVTGGLRVGVSARLAKTAVAQLGDKAADEIELLWPTLVPPYVGLFAWV